MLRRARADVVSATNPQARFSKPSFGEMERGRLRRARGRRRGRAHHESHRCAGRIAVVLDARLRLSPRPQANPRLCGDTRRRHGCVREELATGMNEKLRQPGAGVLCRERQADSDHRCHQWHWVGRAEALTALGADLAIVGRSKTRIRIASARIRAAARKGATVATFIADLSSQTSVRRLAFEVLARYPKLNVLINNAGAMYGTRQLTKDGI